MGVPKTSHSLSSHWKEVDFKPVFPLYVVSLPSRVAPFSLGDALLNKLSGKPVTSWLFALVGIMGTVNRFTRRTQGRWRWVSGLIHVTSEPVAAASRPAV